MLRFGYSMHPSDRNVLAGTPPCDPVLHLHDYLRDLDGIHSDTKDAELGQWAVTFNERRILCSHVYLPGPNSADFWCSDWCVLSSLLRKSAGSVACACPTFVFGQTRMRPCPSSSAAAETK